MKNILNKNKVKNTFSTNVDVYFKRQCLIEIRQEAVKEMLTDIPKDSILDLGCGDGSLSVQFLPYVKNITLVDFSEKMLELAQENIPPQYKEKVEIYLEDIEGFMPSQKYDVVFCIGVLAHVENIHQCIQKVIEALKPGGHCIIQITDMGTCYGRLLYFYSKLLKKNDSKSLYDMNEMDCAGFLALTNSFGLQLVKEIRYVILPHLYRFMPLSIEKNISLWIMRNKRLSAYCPEVMLMFTRRI